jgi:Right handed beta helix region
MIRKTVLMVATILSLLFVSCSKDDAESTTPVTPPFDGPSAPATHFVGPTRTFKTLQEVADQLKPGDIVDVDGDHEYAGGITLSESGTADKPITIRGVKVNGKRPVIKQGPKDRIIVVDGSYTILDGLEVIGKPDETTQAGMGVYGNNIVIRDCIIHDCRNAVLGYGSGTGNVLVEYCEIYNCGGEPKGNLDFAHQIYMATDEVQYPNAVFRLQHCYIHDAKGGNNVKTRSGRNEIYYNWIEGARYHAIELIGPDLDDNDEMTETTKREDSDVVGNVLIATSNGSAARIGGDGTGSTSGRYRFVNNTFIIKNNADGLRGLDDIETVELYNNIFYKANGDQADIFSEADVAWVNGNRQLHGSNNYISPGSSKVPAGLTGILAAATPDFTDVNTKDFSLKSTSTLINAGATSTPTFSGSSFPSPLFPVSFHPPIHTHTEAGKAIVRPSNGVLDVGALER